MSRHLRLSHPRLFAAAAVSAGIAVSLAVGAAGSSAQAQTSSPSAHDTQLVSLASSSAPRKTVTCTPKITKIKVKKVARPYNHLLLSATNISKKKNCNAFSFPALAMGKDAQAATWEIRQSRPQAVVTLFPGETAYASIIISGIDQREDNYVAHELGVGFFNKKGTGSTGEKWLKLPGKGVINANDAVVTYWQDSKKDALSW